MILDAPFFDPSIHDGFTNWFLRAAPERLNLLRGKTAALPVYAIRLTCRSRGNGEGDVLPRALACPGSQSSWFMPGLVRGAPCRGTEGHSKAPSGAAPDSKRDQDQCRYPLAGTVGVRV